jgi:hypothetical protein
MVSLWWHHTPFFYSLPDEFSHSLTLGKTAMPQILNRQLRWDSKAIIVYGIVGKR